MDQAELTRKLLESGVFDGKRAPEKRVLLAYKINQKHGNIRMEGNKIVLPPEE